VRPRPCQRKKYGLDARFYSLVGGRLIRARPDWNGLLALTRYSTHRHFGNRGADITKELPKRKQVVTQDRSKVLKETERDPFEDEEDEEAQQAASRSAAPSPTPGAAPKSHKSKPSSSGISSSLFGSTTPTKSKKSKKGSKSKSGPFNLEAEKANMKTTPCRGLIERRNVSRRTKLALVNLSAASYSEGTFFAM
jgi:hypothetical protein